MVNPVEFQPEHEQPELNEPAAGGSLEDILAEMRHHAYKESGTAWRSLHAKSHGIVNGTLAVVGGLPPQYAQGLFSAEGTYDAILRFSTLPGAVLDDQVLMPRGAALKIRGVPGEHLADARGGDQDILVVNAPTFGAPTVADFDKFLRAQVAPLTNASKGFDVPNTQILGETFYSQTPFLYGHHICKFSFEPVSPTLLALAGEHVDTTDNPDALRDSVVEHFAANGGEWDLKVQLNTDLAAMPIEDSTVEWPQSVSPYVTVARFSAPA